MRTHVLQSVIKTIFDEWGERNVKFKVKAIKENDQEYLISFKDKVHIPYKFLKYLETIGLFGIRFTGKSVLIDLRPNIPNLTFCNYQEIGEYFDKLYPNLAFIESWVFSEQKPFTIYQMSKGIDCWVFKPSNAILKEYENIRKQLEFITHGRWKIVVSEKEGEKGWLRYEFKEFLLPPDYE